MKTINNMRTIQVIELFLFDNITQLREIDESLQGFLIFDDDYITKFHTAIVSTRTGTQHAIIERKEFIQRKFKNEIYGHINCGPTRYENRHSILKVENQDKIDVGDRFYAVIDTKILHHNS